MPDADTDCIFCKIVNKEIDVPIEFEEESIIAFNDKNPQAPVHILIIPKKHIESVNEIANDSMGLIGEIMVAAKEISKKRKIFDPGYRLVINCGKDGGQLVRHLHVHLLGGRELGWPPG